MATLSHRMRVYRDDNGILDPEYITVIDDQACYLTELLQVSIPDWKHAIIRLVRRIDPPDPGLLDHSVTALTGWHYLLDETAIEMIEHEELLLHEASNSLWRRNIQSVEPST